MKPHKATEQVNRPKLILCFSVIAFSIHVLNTLASLIYLSIQVRDKRNRERQSEREGERGNERARERERERGRK